MDPAALVGRDEELAHVVALLAEGRPAVLVGESGVGKTSLIRAAVASSGRRAWFAGGLSTLSYLPYAAVARAVPRLRTAGDHANVASELERLVGSGILVIDDVQWTDASTRSLLPFLSGRIGLVGAVRQGDPGAGAALEAVRGADFEVIDVEPLEGPEAVVLARRLRPDLATSGIRRLIDRSGGNPLLMEELASTDEPSASLAIALEARLRRLSTKARDAFTQLALLGRPARSDELDAGARRELDAAGLTVPEGDRIAIRHALLAETAVDGLTTSDRRAMHARIARFVDDSGEAARHHARAGERAAAFAKAMAAARDAGTRDERAEHLALAATVADGPEALRVRLDATEALVDIGQPSRARELLEDVETGDPVTAARVDYLRAKAVWGAGDEVTARALLERASRRVAKRSAPIAVDILIERSREKMFAPGGLRTARRLADRALQIALDQRHAVHVARHAVGTAAVLRGDDDWSRQLELAQREARRVGDTQIEFKAAKNRVLGTLAHEGPVAAMGLADRMIRRAIDLQLRSWEWPIRLTRLECLVHVGRYGEVLREADDLSAQALEQRDLDVVENLRATALIDLGELDAAATLLDELRDRPSMRYSRSERDYQAAEAAYARGRLDEALLAIEQSIAGLDAGDPNRVLPLVARSWIRSAFGTDPGPPVPRPPWRTMAAAPVEMRAVRLMANGRDHRRTADAFQEAARLWAGFHLRGELRCLWAAGEAWRRLGDVERAREVLLDVELRARSHGMRPLLVRIGRSLRLSGVHRAAPRRASEHGLTEREMEILRLAAGMTNAQIAQRLGVGRPTVARLISSAEGKLGASTRAQAVAMVSRQA